MKRYDDDSKGCVNFVCIFGGGSLFLGFLLFCLVEWIVWINFERECSGHLKRAGDSNTVARALEELNTAIEYMEENSLTKGSTHVIWFLQECDVEFWYENLREARDELAEFPSDAEPLTVSNQLMKLRETLLDDNDEGGIIVTLPPRIAYFPNHRLWFWGGTVIWIVGVVGGIVACFAIYIRFES